MEFGRNQGCDIYYHLEQEAQREQKINESVTQREQYFQARILPSKLKPLESQTNHIHINMQQLNKGHPFSSCFDTSEPVPPINVNYLNSDYMGSSVRCLCESPPKMAFVPLQSALGKNFINGFNPEFLEPVFQVHTAQIHKEHDHNEQKLPSGRVKYAYSTPLLPVLWQQAKHIDRKQGDSLQKNNHHSLFSDFKLDDTSFDVDLIPSSKTLITKIHVNGKQASLKPVITRSQNMNSIRHDTLHNEDSKHTYIPNHTTDVKHTPEIWYNDSVRKKTNTNNRNLNTTFRSNALEGVSTCPQYYDFNNRDEVMQKHSTLTDEIHSIPFSDVLYRPNSDEKNRSNNNISVDGVVVLEQRNNQHQYEK